MPFSTDCKKELCAVKPEKPCCLLSELCALYLSCGSLSLLGRGRVNAQFVSENLAVARRAYTLMVQSLGLTPQIHYVTSARFGGTRRCVLTLGPVQSPVFLTALGMMEESPEGGYTLRATTPRYPLKRGCCMRAFLRGALLGGGTLSSPDRGYHLELSYRDEDARAMLAKCLQRLNLPVKQSARGEKPFLYLKQSDQIVTFLTAVGAHQAVMQLEDLRVKREVIGKVNRAMNCDASNLRKQLKASDEQREAIGWLGMENRLDALPDTLREIARARMLQPEATLEELGQSLSPPLGKSGVNHRMRRLMAYVKQHREEIPHA